jgi:chaperonin GroES
MKVRPIGDKILVKRLEAKDVSKGGIVLPDSAKEKPQEAKVVALGDGRMTEEGKSVPFTVKKGDRVIFTSYAGSEVKDLGEDYLIMSEDDIMAIVE